MTEPRPAATSLEQQVARARAGDRSALEAVLRAVQPDVHRLALRFLWHPEDAEDAAQEALLRVVTGLGGFRGESDFRTWVHRVAVNVLLSLRQQRMERQALSFEEFGDDLAAGLGDAAAGRSSPEDALLLEEVKIGCTQGMLLCLDRDHRMAYILGEILELDHREAAEVLEITPAAFRKRLSRARSRITSFMRSHCGLFDLTNPCRCRRRVGAAVALGRVDPDHLLFATSARRAQNFPAVLAEVRRLEETRRAAALYRSHPDPPPSGSFASWLRGVLDDRSRTPPA